MRSCLSCGAAFGAEALFCGRCGASMPTLSPQSSPGQSAAKPESALPTVERASLRDEEKGGHPEVPAFVQSGFGIVETRKGRGRKVVVAVSAVLVLAIAAWVVVIPNVKLQSAMTGVRNRATGNSAVHVSVHLKDYVDHSTLIYDLQDIDAGAAPIDVFRVLLQFADEVQSQRFREVILAFRGTKKFKLEGVYFHTLGEEYGVQNPVYTTRTFPENVLTPAGTHAFSEWTGGVLGVLGAQLDDFNSFNRQWYLDDLNGP